MTIQTNVDSTTRMFSFQEGKVTGLSEWPLKPGDDGMSFEDVMRAGGFYCVYANSKRGFNLEIWESRDAENGFQFMVAMDAGSCCYEVFVRNLFDLAGCLECLRSIIDLPASDGDE